MPDSKRAKSVREQPEQNEALKKVRLHINAFGEIVRDIQTEDINAFLDENVPDKKFSEQADMQDKEGRTG